MSTISTERRANIAMEQTSKPDWHNTTAAPDFIAQPAAEPVQVGTFAHRCQVSEQCLPESPYRSMLMRLHADMLAAMTNPPQHKWWAAGEPDCPSDIKATNGELHTLRCKVCGLDRGAAGVVCFAATEQPDAEPLTDKQIDAAMEKP